MGVSFQHRLIAISTAMLIVFSGNLVLANESGESNTPPSDSSACNEAMSSAGKGKQSKRAASTTPRKSAAKTATTSSTEETRTVASNGFTLESFFASDDSNLAVLHPFTLANAAEKAYSMLNHVPGREAVDPLFKVNKVTVHPMVAGEHPASGGSMVVGQEESIHNFISFLGAIARGDRSGKAIGFPGPPGTGKTELLNVYARIEMALGKEDKYKQWSYRFRGLEKVPFLRNLFRFDRDGNKNLEYIDPDMPRSPFTLLREDMQQQVLRNAIPKIREKWGMTISKGWTKPEPKTAAILRAIFQHEFPDIAEGRMSVDDLTAQQYLNVLLKYVVIVPKTLLQPKSEVTMLRAQTDNPNWQALFAAPNLARQAFYGQNHALSIDYTGKVFKQDGGLLMIDEMYRNPPELLNIFLEVVQNRMVETDYGDPVELDAVPVWNSNDESIEQARQNAAIKASLDRAEPNPMRLLLVPNQIEAVSIFQVDAKRFKQRFYDSQEVTPLDYTKIYPATDALGKTETAYGRAALYYSVGDRDILLAPMTLNYVSWLAAASRFVTDPAKLKLRQDELNLVTQNPGLFTDPILRLRIAIGDRSVEHAEKVELARVKHLMAEGQTGISSRDVETWLRAAINLAVEEGSSVLTPRMLDIVFGQLLDRGVISPPKDEVRAYWQLLRMQVKRDILLPRLEQDVKAIISGDGQKAERVYDEIEREFLELAANPEANTVLPDDGSQATPINRTRLEKIKQIYARKFGREFQPLFLVKQLRNARQGRSERDGQLLDAVREFLAQADALTADYISSFDAMYKKRNNDPETIERAGHVEARLWQFGYDVDSFKEAVAYVAQLRAEKAAPKQ